MATRTLKYTEWLKLVMAAPRDGGIASITGLAVSDAADKLKVSTQRVYQLIGDGVLDTLDITTRAGKVSMSLVTEASLERYLAQRTPDRNRQGYFAFQA